MLGRFLSYAWYFFLGIPIEFYKTAFELAQDHDLKDDGGNLLFGIFCFVVIAFIIKGLIGVVVVLWLFPYAIIIWGLSQLDIND